MFLDQLNYLSIMIPTINIVYIVRYIFDGKLVNKRIFDFIVAVSSTTFGIYLIHGVLLGKLKVIYNFMNIYLPNLLSTMIWQLVIFVILCITVYIIKKIPVIKKII